LCYLNISFETTGWGGWGGQGGYAGGYGGGIISLKTCYLISKISPLTGRYFLYLRLL